MSKKPKRIRAKKAYCGEGEGIVISSPCVGWTEPCYILRQSDIRALAEQFVRDAMHFVYAMNESRGKERIDTALYMLRRAGITPGKEAQ